MSTIPQTLDAFLARYRRNVRLYAREVLGFEPEPWQDELFDQYDKRTRLISVKSGHGVGKSTALAVLMTHHQLCFFPQKTVVTAPTSTQLWDALWAEYKSMLTKLPPHLLARLDPKQEKVVLKAAPDESFVSARTSRAEQPDALQGVHSPWVLLIADEASGIPNAVFEAASGSMSGHNAITILTGNPVRAQGFFFDTFTKLADMWWTKTVSCIGSRLVSPEYVEDMRRRYGELSNAYRVRVLGEFPVRDDDTVIPFDLVEAALARDIAPILHAPTVWGVDPARFGSDRSTLAKRRGTQLLEPVRYWHQLDTMELAARVKLEYDQTANRPHERPVEINVDVIGIGAGVVDRLRQFDLPARGINVSESPSTASGEKYRNLKAELWFRGRDFFAARDCTLPRHYKNPKDGEDLVLELTTPRYKFTPSGKIIVESKDELRKRGMPSPDLAEAFLLTLASDAITLQQGSSANRTRGPLRRALKMLQGV